MNGISAARAVKLFLCGDVMLGRGVDQALPHSCPPRIYESHMTSALDYVALAERSNGPIPRPVSYEYVWGDALAAWDRFRPDVRIINLETSVTARGEPMPKGINYRMHPENVPVITAAGVDACVLANNHVLDWGEEGLLDTLDSLRRAAVNVAGAGHNRAEAEAPLAVRVDAAHRVLVIACGATDSGIPPEWAATDACPGVHLLPDFSAASAEAVMRVVAAARRPGDVAIVSIHWGGNWGYEIPRRHRRFAHALIDHGADLVHGHSSHHAKAIEVYRNRLILYGCGDFLDDYEGISGYEQFRDDLTLMYFPSLDADTGELIALEMLPLQIRNFRLRTAPAPDRAWLHATLERECRAFGLGLIQRDDTFFLEFGSIRF